MRILSNIARGLLALIAGCLGLAATACDYPEQGFYSLVALDGYELPVAEWPLLVEEQVDDTGMTVSFSVLLPVDGELVETGLTDASDATRRAWLVRLGDRLTGAGALDLTLSHAANLLSFSGAYQPATVDAADGSSGPGPVFPVAGLVRPGEVPGTGNIISNGDLPPLPVHLATTRRFELRSITRGDFERILGCGIDEAVRRRAVPVTELVIDTEVPRMAEQPVDGTEVASGEEAPVEEASTPPAEEKEKPKSPPLGGRRGTRPR